MTRRRGFMFIDAVVALGLVSAVAILLIITHSSMTRALRQVDARRQATQIAEKYLIDAAPSRTPATQPASTHVTVTDLPTAAPAGWKWVNVRVAVNERTGEVVGLVRRGS